MIKTIDAQMVAKMFLGGAKNLESNKEWINELNVFPVPDGDTGTNMTMTITAAAADVSKLDNPDMYTPVSYTHLDVYKRQSEGSAFRESGRTYGCGDGSESCA